MGQEKTIEPSGGWRPLSFKYKVKKIMNWLKNQSLLSIDQKKELEGPVASTRSKKAPEISKNKPKGPWKKQRGPKNNHCKADWHIPYPHGYRILKLEPSAVESVLNITRTLMEFTEKEKEKMNSTYPHK
ncbi:hypothetical protein O181_064433 [Austropuccinia psidii MF-1]|uniref:Uncharacterized protein n=1 Tax=Austropuccinia psidii MF-1 TaxID=1389203 RepID=A0A9Q3EMZ5_9BASI|nr:hypothetical protein [Austropuccinia psidii MF-1]